MPSPRGRAPIASRKKTRNNSFLPYFLSVVMAIVLIVFWMISSRSSFITDQVTLCPHDASRTEEIHAIIIDLTNGISDAEQVQILQFVNQIKLDLPRFSRLVISGLRDVPSILDDPIFDKCNPGTGEGMSSIYENPTLARRQWEAGFSNQLDLALEPFLESAPSERSEILLAIRQHAIRLLSDPVNIGKKRTLYVISDLMQFSPNQYSHYRDSIEPYATFRQMPYFQAVRSDLRGIEVELYYVRRPKYSVYQTASHIQFWTEFLQDNGAIVTRVRNIYGD